MTDNLYERAEFNDSIGFLNRLNALFALCDDAAMRLDALTWYHGLRCLRRELSGYIKADTIPNKFNEIDKLIPIKQPKVSVIPADLYKLLDETEIELRKVYKESGLMIKEQMNPRLRV